jgi:hypothetical protein
VLAIISLGLIYIQRNFRPRENLSGRKNLRPILNEKICKKGPKSGSEKVWEKVHQLLAVKSMQKVLILGKTVTVTHRLRSLSFSFNWFDIVS